MATTTMTMMYAPSATNAIRLRLRTVLWIVATVVCLSRALALVPNRKSWKRNPSSLTTSQTSNNKDRKTMTMYFDDVSRHGALQWDPSSYTSSSSLASIRQTPSTITPKRLPSTSSPMDPKPPALQPRVLRYDAQSASQLTSEEVVQVVQQWSTKAGVVGRSLGDELYGQHLGSVVCPATTLVGALAQFWSSLSEFLRQHTTELSRTTLLPADSVSSLSSPSIRSGREADQVYYMIFPTCSELYSYSTMCTLVTSIEFTKEVCVHLNQKELSIGWFHPHYQQSPHLSCPEKHSPFPIVALQLDEWTRHSRTTTLRHPLPNDARPPPPPKRQRGNFIVRKPQVIDDEEEDDEETIQRAYGRIYDLDQQRSIYEVLFNSAAVPGSDGHMVGSPHHYFQSPKLNRPVLEDNDDEDDDGDEFDPDRTSPEQELSRTFQKERQWRQGRSRQLDINHVQKVCWQWMQHHRFINSGRSYRAQQRENRALRYIDTIGTNRWTISHHKVAELVYADIWLAISDLYELGKEAEQRVESTMNDTTEDVQTTEYKDFAPLPNQIHFMLRPFLSRPSATSADNKSTSRREPRILSSMFVSTKFCAYNAPAFKRFAITVNAAMKRLSKGCMFLEVFHNEYVGQDGFDHSLRRSPFPMIQICYKVGAASSKQTDSSV